MIGVDTNVLVRYFAGDDPAQGDVVEGFLSRQRRKGQQVRVGLVVVAELVWVLRTRYGASRIELSRVTDELLTDPCIDVQDRHAVAVAAGLFETTKGEFADLLVAAVNAFHGCTHTVTFDRAASKLTGMALIA